MAKRKIPTNDRHGENSEWDPHIDGRFSIEVSAENAAVLTPTIENSLLDRAAQLLISDAIRYLREKGYERLTLNMSMIHAVQPGTFAMLARQAEEGELFLINVPEDMQSFIWFRMFATLQEDTLYRFNREAQEEYESIRMSLEQAA